MLNPYIEVPFIVWAVAQLIKFSLKALKGKTDFRYLYASGGMPSVHSATVVALAMTALLIDGVDSPIFGFTAVFAGIVMYDSFGVRRASGEQGAAINVILSSLDTDKIPLNKPQAKLREILGHTPFEVTVGAILGAVLGALLNYSYLDGLWATLTTETPTYIAYVLIGLGVVGILGAAAQFTVVRRRYRGITSGERSARWAGWITLVAGLAALVLGFLQQQDITNARWIIWPFVALLPLIAARVYSWRYFSAPVKAEVAARADQAEKAKWLEGPNKKKAKAKAKKR